MAKTELFPTVDWSPIWKSNGLEAGPLAEPAHASKIVTLPHCALPFIIAAKNCAGEKEVDVHPFTSCGRFADWDKSKNTPSHVTPNDVNLAAEVSYVSDPVVGSGTPPEKLMLYEMDAALALIAQAPINNKPGAKSFMFYFLQLIVYLIAYAPDG